MAQAPQPMQGGMLPPDQPDSGAPPADGGQASPEEQALYEEMFKNCMTLIYGTNQRAKQVLKSLGASSNFVMNLANVAAHIVVAAEASAKKAGKQLPDDVVTKVGEDVLRELALYSQKGGVHTFTDKELEQAALQAIDLYRQLGTQAGVVDANALKQQFGQLVQQQGGGTGGPPAAPPDDEQAEPAAQPEEAA